MADDEAAVALIDGSLSGMSRPRSTRLMPILVAACIVAAGIWLVCLAGPSTESSQLRPSAATRFILDGNTGGIYVGGNITIINGGTSAHGGNDESPASGDKANADRAATRESTTAAAPAETTAAPTAAASTAAAAPQPQATTGAAPGALAGPPPPKRKDKVEWRETGAPSQGPSLLLLAVAVAIVILVAALCACYFVKGGLQQSDGSDIDSQEELMKVQGDNRAPDSLGSRVFVEALEVNHLNQNRMPLRQLFEGVRASALGEALLRIAEGHPGGQMAAFHPDTGAMVRHATRKAREANRKFPDLSQDECTAIVLYTMEANPRESSLYYAMNAALRSLDRTTVRPWVAYVMLLIRALQKLPPSDIRVVYRGCKGTPDQMNMNLRVGEDFCWAAFSSVATTANVMQRFLGVDGQRTMIHFELTEGTARDVRDFSLHPVENELVLPPNTCGRVQANWSAGAGLTMIQCKQQVSADGIWDLQPDH